jgi:hypothetical protein
MIGLTGPGSSVYVSTQTNIENKNGSRLFTTLPFLIEALHSDIEIHSTHFSMDDPDINLTLAFYSIRALHANGQPSMDYSFFARVKLDSAYVKADLQPSKRILLASPLYLANRWKA